MAAGIVEGHIVVQAGVHAAGAQAIGQRPEAELPGAAAGGKAKQSRRRHGHAEGRDPAGSEAQVQPLTQQAGHHRAHRNNDEDHPGKGHRRPQLRHHAGPGRPQQSVRQAQADKGHINNRQKQVHHGRASLFVLSQDYGIIS